MMAPNLRVGFLGTGLMGAPMACNSAQAGLSVTAWNRTPETLAMLADRGVVGALSPAEAAAGADVLLVMVSTGEVSNSVLFASQSGAILGLARGSIVVMMSSIPVEMARTQAARLAEHGVAYVDAPVSGGDRGAHDGALTIMAGGQVDVLQRLSPVFAPLGKVTHVGPVGSGRLAKLANQMIVGVTIGAVSEALLLAERGGADISAVRAALMGGFADSTILRQYGARMIEGRFQPGAHATTQLKDLHTARLQGEALGLDLTITRLVENSRRRCAPAPAPNSITALFILSSGITPHSNKSSHFARRG